MTTSSPSLYSTPLLSSYGSDSRSLLFAGHNYKTTATIKQLPHRLSGSHTSLGLSSAVELSSPLLSRLQPSSSNDDNDKRSIGVAKNGLITSLNGEITTASGILGDAMMDTRGAISGGVVVPRGVWFKRIGFTGNTSPLISLVGGMNLTEHDHGQAPEMQRYVGTTYVSPWLSAGVSMNQVVPSYASGDETLPTSSISPAYVIPTLSCTLPRHISSLWNNKLAAIQSPIAIGSQVKIPIDGSSPSFDSGIQYKREDDVSLSCMSTNNMTGARLTYHVPVSARDGVRAVACSYDIRPVGSTKNLRISDIFTNNGSIVMRRALSVGASLGWNSNVTGKVRLDSDATFSYALKYAVNGRASIGASQQWCLQQKKPLAFGLQLELTS